MLKRSMTAAVAVISLAALSFGHLPPSYDASLRMGRTGVAGNGKSLRASGYSNKGVWSADSSYSGSYTLRQGDTVQYGTWPSNDPNGKKLWWWAKFAASGADKPGTIKEGGTSAWVLINSLSASTSGTPNYQWKGWNGQIANKSSGVWAEVPTWRNGAEGAYTFTHDDIGSMTFEQSIKPGWDLANESGFEEIKQSWGVFVDAMAKENSWEDARKMVMDGHEMFNHSMDHTSASNRRYLFFPGQTVPEGDLDIPQEVRGLDVVGAWKIMSHHVNEGWGTFVGGQWRSDLWVDWEKNQSAGDQNGDWAGPLKDADGYWDDTYIDTIKAENDLVTIYSYPDWNGNGPGENGKGDWDNDGVIDGLYRIETKQGTEIVVLPTGQKMFVNKTSNKVSANVVGWYEVNDISNRFPFYESVGSTADQGRYGFMLNVFAAEGWSESLKERNVVQSNNVLNANIYSWVGKTPYFKNGKKSEYFGYPFDVYSEETHTYLENKGFTGARGGAKSGVPMSGDFFHPYRIDFDAFFIERTDWTPASQGAGFVYPDNPHMLLGLNEMVNNIIASKGYMIREFHSVANIDNGAAWHTGDDNEKWEVNDHSKGFGGWWGGITKEQLRAHYNHVKEQIDAKKLVVYTASEAVKYRMTANAVTGANISADGGNYKLSVSAGSIPEKYQDEISVIVSFSSGTDKIAITYDGGETPYRAPKKMKEDGTVWSVNVNPYKGVATITPNADWNGPIESESVEGEFVSINGKNRTVANISKASFAGIQGGKIALNLTKGAYTAELYNLQGRLIGRVNFDAVNGVNATSLRVDNLAKGMLILNVKQAGKMVLNNKIMVK